MDVLEFVLQKAKAKGADAADAVLSQGVNLNLSQRLGKRDRLERAEAKELGLRAFVGKRQAIVSTTDLSLESLELLADRVVRMARAVPEDPFCGLADASLLAKQWDSAGFCDPHEPAEEELADWLKEMEEAALEVKGISNSEGAEAGWSLGSTTLATSTGFLGTVKKSRYGLSVSVIAGSGTEMERDYNYSSAVYGQDLEHPASIGREAAERALKRLHPRKIQSGKMSVVYEPRLANSLISHFAGAITGSSVTRGTTFLKDKMGSAVFAKDIQIIDDPLRKRGLRSYAFDGEGLPGKKLTLIEDGILQDWLLDCRSARQLGLQSNGRGMRGGAGGSIAPGASNLYLAAGKESPEELIGSVKDGIYVTELIGFGVNSITGDYSRGAAGFRIENGKITYPVSEITVAGNLAQMFARLIPANDLEFRHGTDAPTILIEGMTVAGQ